MARTQEEMDALFNDDKASSLTTDIVTFEVEGQTVIGRVVKVEAFTDGEFETEVNKYTLHNEDGDFTCVLGAAADKQLAQVDGLIGSVIGIRYLGKKPLKDGRHVNRFTIKDLSKSVKIR